MRIFGRWHGGASYSYGEMETDGESWPSLASTKRSLILRYRSGYWDTDSRYARVINFDDDGVVTLGGSSGSLRPVVTGDTHIDLYPAERIGRGRWRVGNEPYARLILGPRGGVQTESF